MKDEKKQKEMEANGLVVQLEVRRSDEKGEEGFDSSIALYEVSTEEATQILAEALFDTAEKMATQPDGRIEPFELLKVEMTLYRIQKEYQKRVMRKMEEQSPQPTCKDTEADQVLQSLVMALAPKHKLGL